MPPGVADTGLQSGAEPQLPPQLTPIVCHVTKSRVRSPHLAVLPSDHTGACLTALGAHRVQRLLCVPQASLLSGWWGAAHRPLPFSVLSSPKIQTWFLSPGVLTTLSSLRPEARTGTHQAV